MTSSPPTIHTALKDELGRLWRFALHLTNCKQTAEALVRRTFVTAIERRRQYPSRRQWRNWLFGLELRLWQSELRPNRSNLRSITPAMPRQADDQQDTPIAKCFNSQLCETINQLPEAQRLVILLVCVEEFSYRDTAEILDLSIETVTARLARARIAIGSLQRANSTPIQRESAQQMQTVSSPA